MISNEQFNTLVRAMSTVKSVGKSATIAGMHRNTATKYLKAQDLPSNLKKQRNNVSRAEAIKEEHWAEIELILDDSPELEASAAIDYLAEKYNCYSRQQLRSMQRRIKKWRVHNGPDKEVIFWQNYRPGERSQSDFIHMNYLKVTIQGEQYNHLIYHFMLPYSGWEDAMICEGGESFVNLRNGFETALWKLGGATHKHRTDNLQAAIDSKTKEFTRNWAAVTSHYDIDPTVNNPGKSNENGKVERSNGMFKRSIENHLYLRKSRDFASLKDYREFIDGIVRKRNSKREDKFNEEKCRLNALPSEKWYNITKVLVKVHSDSTIRLNGSIYSVPSRAIGTTLTAYQYPDKVDLYYGDKLLDTVTCCDKGAANINFLHVVSSLRRKPGAFEDYKYREYMYPTTTFRRAYDKLKQKHSGKNLSKNYIELLHLAKINDLRSVSKIVNSLLKSKQLPYADTVKKMMVTRIEIPEPYVRQPNLKDYDQLLMGAA